MPLFQRVPSMPTPIREMNDRYLIKTRCVFQLKDDHT